MSKIILMLAFSGFVLASSFEQKLMERWSADAREAWHVPTLTASELGAGFAIQCGSFRGGDSDNIHMLIVARKQPGQISDIRIFSGQEFERVVPVRLKESEVTKLQVMEFLNQALKSIENQSCLTADENAKIGGSIKTVFVIEYSEQGKLYQIRSDCPKLSKAQSDLLDNASVLTNEIDKRARQMKPRANQ